MVEEAPVVTQRVITIDGQELRYTVTTGMLPIKNDTGEIEASLFFMAYTKDFAEEETEAKQTGI